MVFCWVARPDGFAWPSLPPRHDRRVGAQQVSRFKEGQYVTALPVIGFAVVALAAIAFAAVPLWRRVKGTARALLLAAIALFMLAIGGGTYYLLGRPHLAMREAQDRKST